jgi:hypothetical protein
MRDALRDVTKAAELAVDLKPGDIVLDIGSNDGTLLRSYTKQCVRIGVEPADNLAIPENYEGMELIHDFWNYESYTKCVNEIECEDLWLINAKIITAIGMFYDLEDPNQFIADISKALARDGVFIAQLMTLRNMLALDDVGNLAHEHLEFYSLKSLRYLLGRHGLEMFDIETNSVNGQSDRLYICHKNARPTSRRVIAKLGIEVHLDLVLHYDAVFKRWENKKWQCVNFIKKVVAEGKKVWVYGASTKGNTILQYYGLDHMLIEGACDINPEKIGKFTVGSMIPIYSQKYARTKADYFLVLPYAFLDEFMANEAEWRAGGGKFLVPLPEFRVV